MKANGVCDSACPGWPRVGEEVVVARNILLSELCDSPIHCQHISSAGSVRLLRDAKARGVKISGEVCPHHIALTDQCLQTFDSNYKMNPPLRTERDIEALLEGLADGTLDVLCSDHAPHAFYEKEVELDQAPFGITGLETEFALCCDILRPQAEGHRLAAPHRAFYGKSRSPPLLESRNAFNRRNSRCDSDRPGP